MALSPAERKLLEKLQAKADAPDAEDFEVRIRNSAGEEASVPASRASGWLQERFGISLFDDDGTEEDQGEEGDDGGEPARSYFRGKGKAAKTS